MFAQCEWHEHSKVDISKKKIQFIFKLCLFIGNFFIMYDCIHTI